MAPDNLSFSVKLRQGVKWHDGKGLTAQDFVDMYGYTKDEVLVKYLGVSKIKGIMAPVKDVKATDPYTLVFSFEKPTPYITDILDYFFAIRITDKTDPQFLKAAPIGTGPFKLAKWTPTSSPRWTSSRLLPQGPAAARSVHVQAVQPGRDARPESQVRRRRRRPVDQPERRRPAPVREQLQRRGEQECRQHLRPDRQLSKPPLDKREVRQALSYSLNREGMAKSAFFGVSQPITSPIYSQSSLAYREDLLMAHKFDLDKAKSMLEAAGVKNLELRTATRRVAAV